MSEAWIVSSITPSAWSASSPPSYAAPGLPSPRGFRNLVPSGALTEWQRDLSSKKGRAAHGIHEAPIFWIDNKRGTGCRDVRKAVLSLGEYVNRRRARKAPR